MNSRMWERGYIKERSWGLRTAQTEGMTTCASEWGDTDSSFTSLLSNLSMYLKCKYNFKASSQEQKQITYFHSITLEKLWKGKNRC